MGGRSNKSQQDTNTNIDYQDRKFSTESGLVATEGSALSSTVNTSTVNNVLDAGAIKAASDLVGKTIDANSSGLQAAYSLAGGLGTGAFDLAGGLGKDAFGLSDRVSKGAFDLSAYTVKTVAEVTRENAADAMASTNKSAGLAMETVAGTARDSIASNQNMMRDTMAYTTGVNTTMAKTYDSALGMVGTMSGTVMDALTSANKESNGVAANAISQVNRAWGDAKQAEKDLAGGDYRMLMVIGAAVIGVVAVMGMMKK